MTKKMLLLTALLIVTIPGSSFAVDFAVRLSPEFVYYYLSAPTEDTEKSTWGLSAGGTVLVGPVYLDLSSEIMAVPVYNPKLRTIEEDGARSEYAVLLGINFYESASFFAGYRYVMFGESFYSEDFMIQKGPVAGIALTNLRMGENDQNLFTFNIALHFAETEYKDDDNTTFDTTSPGFSARIGYRRAGTPHGFALRFQIMGAQTDESRAWPLNETPEEFVSSIQYTFSY